MAIVSEAKQPPYPFQCSCSQLCACLVYCNFLTGFWSHKCFFGPYIVKAVSPRGNRLGASFPPSCWHHSSYACLGTPFVADFWHGGSPVGLSPSLVGCVLTSGSVRTEMNRRTPTWCQKIGELLGLRKKQHGDIYIPCDKNGKVWRWSVLIIVTDCLFSVKFLSTLSCHIDQCL